MNSRNSVKNKKALNLLVSMKFSRKQMIGLNKFNQEFENQKNEENELKIKNPFEQGYGELLDESEVNLEYHENEIKKPITKISQQIMKYEEPAFLPDSINYYPLNQEEITDFSSLDGNLNGYDYKLTHSNKDMLEEEMKKLEINYKFSDYPKENRLSSLNYFKVASSSKVSLSKFVSVVFSTYCGGRRWGRRKWWRWDCSII